MSDVELCRHGLASCERCVVVTDAAKRMSELINLLILCQPWDALIHGCLAFRLDDGTSDNVLYPNRQEALKYQLRPCAVFHFRNSPGGVNPKDCQIFLNISRMAYENDRVAWTDPASPDLIMSQRGYDYLSGKRW